MDKKIILDAIAPCSLCCHTCHAKKGGIVEATTKSLLNYYTGYLEFEKKVLPRKFKCIMKEDKKFVEMLQKKSNAKCLGCRNSEHGKYCIENCFILECTKQHGIDFCGECPEFPCEKINQLFVGEVLNDWKYGNQRIKDIGIENFYNEAIARSHYSSYAKKE